jgi:hypothetical protein
MIRAKRGPEPWTHWLGSIIAVLAIVSGDALAADAEQANETIPPTLVEVGDVRFCHSILLEPNLNGQAVGEVEVAVEATIEADGKVSAVDVPGLASMDVQSWVRSRILRFAKCVAKAAKFRPATRDGQPVAATVTMPVRQLVADSGGMEPRKFLRAEVSSSPEELETVYRACATAETKHPTTLQFEFTVATDGRAQDVRQVSVGIIRDLANMGKCIIEGLRFVPHVENGRVTRQKMYMVLQLLPVES